jgi:hypothetical protein
MRKLIFVLIAVAAICTFGATSANAALYPIIGQANINSTSALQKAMRERPDIAAKMAEQAGVKNPKLRNWIFCGDVTSAERSDLERKGYKNTAYDSNGTEETLADLKDEPLVWACYVNVDKVERDLKRRLGRDVRVRCTTRRSRKGAVTVTCKGRNSTIRVTEPTKANRIPVGRNCFNRQHTGKPTTLETIVTGLYTAWETEQVKKGKRKICPDGSWAFAKAGARARGFGFGKTRREAVKMAKKNASVNAAVRVGCGPGKKPRVVERVVERIVERPVPTPTPTPESPKASATCDFMIVQNSLTSNLTVDAVVFYTAEGASLTNVEYNWGDGNRDNLAADRASHTYAAAGTYIISAKLTFTKDGGRGTFTSNCADYTITPKDGTPGPGTGIPSQPGGPGAGGEPGPDPGTGESCRLPDGSVGYKDQFGHCNEYPLAA